MPITDEQRNFPAWTRIAAYEDDLSREQAKVKFYSSTAQELREALDRAESRIAKLEAPARLLVDYRRRVGSLGFQVEKADDYIHALDAALVGYGDLGSVNPSGPHSQNTASQAGGEDAV